MLLNIATTLLLILIIITILPTATSAPPQPRSASCSHRLVSFSPCLPYASLPPNNITNTPPPLCCNALSSLLTLTSSNNVSSSSSLSSSYCLCYLLNNTSLFGFPLNSSRLLALPSSCSAYSNSTLLPLDTVCSATSRLPPLVDTAESNISKAFTSGPSIAIVPAIGLSPEVVENSAGSFRRPANDGETAVPGTIDDSSRTLKQIDSDIIRILLGVMIVKVWELICF